MTDQDKAVLVRLVITHWMQYSLKKGARKPFWNKIRALLQIEIGKSLKQPEVTIKQLADECRALVQEQQRESGTVQTDSEMDQNLDRWLEREDELKKEIEDAKKPKERLDVEAAQARVHRDNLMLLAHKKRNYCSQDNDSQATDNEESVTPQLESYHDDDGNDTNQETCAISTNRGMQKKTRQQDKRKKEEAADMVLVGALDSLGARIGGSMEKMVAVQSADAVESVEREDAGKALRAVEKVNEWLDVFEAVMTKESKETKDLLQTILGRLPQ